MNDMAGTATAAKKKTMRHASAQKAARQAETRRLRNRSNKRAVREAVRETFAAAAANGASDAQTQTLLRDASALLDKAARRGVIHWKAAARRKSRLLARLKAPAPAATPVAAKTPAAKTQAAPAK